MKDTCTICGQYKKMRIKDIGIAFGMIGETYSICYKCTKELNVDQFFRKLAARHHYIYPLRLKE